jgi:hypothetical protein
MPQQLGKLVATRGYQGGHEVTHVTCLPSHELALSLISYEAAGATALMAPLLPDLDAVRTVCAA